MLIKGIRFDEVQAGDTLVLQVGLPGFTVARDHIEVQGEMIALYHTQLHEKIRRPGDHVIGLIRRSLPNGITRELLERAVLTQLSITSDAISRCTRAEDREFHLSRLRASIEAYELTKPVGI